jgi:hypothetical protein
MRTKRELIAWFIAFVFFCLLTLETYGGEPTEQVRAAVQDRVGCSSRSPESLELRRELLCHRREFRRNGERSLGVTLATVEGGPGTGLFKILADF